MKLKKLAPLAFSVLILASCGNEGNSPSGAEKDELEQMDSVEAEVKESDKKLEEQTKKVEEALEKMDKEYQKEN